MWRPLKLLLFADRSCQNAAREREEARRSDSSRHVGALSGSFHLRVARWCESKLAASGSHRVGSAERGVCSCSSPRLRPQRWCGRCDRSFDESPAGPTSREGAAAGSSGTEENSRRRTNRQWHRAQCTAPAAWQPQQRGGASLMRSHSLSQRFAQWGPIQHARRGVQQHGTRDATACVRYQWRIVGAIHPSTRTRSKSFASRCESTHSLTWQRHADDQLICLGLVRSLRMPGRCRCGHCELASAASSQPALEAEGGSEWMARRPEHAAEEDISIRPRIGRQLCSCSTVVAGPRNELISTGRTAQWLTSSLVVRSPSPSPPCTMAPLKLYFDAMSQPSRAVWMLLLESKQPFEKKQTLIAQGATRTLEYLGQGGSRKV